MLPMQRTNEQIYFVLLVLFQFLFILSQITSHSSQDTLIYLLKVPVNPAEISPAGGKTNSSNEKINLTVCQCV